jgi:signal transduction histidine kinase
MIVVAFAGALLFAYSLTLPIRQLQQGVKQIGLGNLDYALHVRSNDELGDLASEFNNMRLRLKEIRLREENLSQLKSEFVSIVAHQLRTPLSALKWALSLFQEGQQKASKDQRELIGKMTTSNQRMINLVNDLLDAARIEEGRFVYKRTQTAIEEVIQSVLAATHEKSAQKKVRVLFKEPIEPLPSISIDREAIELAVQNLIENAINYTKSEGSVEISATRSGDNSLLVSVEDTGIGIDPKNKDRMFTKFFRGVNALRMETEGSGLGLFIVKNVIEAHDGKIWFESQVGKGTTFHFTLPLQ